MDASREIQGNIHLCINSIFNVSRILGTYHQAAGVFWLLISTEQNRPPNNTSSDIKQPYAPQRIS